MKRDLKEEEEKKISSSLNMFIERPSAVVEAVVEAVSQELPGLARMASLLHVLQFLIVSFIVSPFLSRGTQRD